jgi:hypothetical protein
MPVPNEHLPESRLIRAFSSVESTRQSRFGIHISAFTFSHSAFAIRHPIRHSPFGIQFGIRHSASSSAFGIRFGIWHSAIRFGIQHSAFDSAFGIQHSAFNSALGIRHSPMPIGLPTTSFVNRQSKTRHSAIGPLQSTRPPSPS